MKEEYKEKMRPKIIILILISPIILAFISLFLGHYGLSLGDVIKIIRSGYSDNMGPEQTVIWNIRLPRALIAILVGGALSVSGGTLQGVFKNPLVDSGMLGVSAGAGFGASLAIIIFDNTAIIYIFAFIFGISAVGLSLLAGKAYKGNNTISIVLGGVIISSIFSSLIAFLKYIADPYQDLATITFWLMGSLASADYSDLKVSFIPIVIGILGIMLLRWRINILSIGDKEAKSLGIELKFTRNILIVCTSLATAGAVCVSGTIGWIGLIIPHIVRMIIGNDNRIMLPIAFCMGGSFLIIIDNIARTISGGEIPIGILTSLIGGPFYIYLLRKTKGERWK